MTGKWRSQNGSPQRGQVSGDTWGYIRPGTQKPRHLAG